MDVKLEQNAGKCAPTVYFANSTEHPFDLSRAGAGLSCTLASVAFDDWNDALTPWPAEGLRHREPFGGMADETLVEFGKASENFEKDHGLAPSRRSLAGYSLGGLFALYAFLHCPSLDAAASISGSLWYDGFATYVRELDFPTEGRFVYLSLGTKEKRGMRKRLKTVEEATSAIAKLLEGKGVTTEFALTPGAHFDHVDDRIRAALESLQGYFANA